MRAVKPCHGVPRAPLQHEHEPGRPGPIGQAGQLTDLEAAPGEFGYLPAQPQRRAGRVPPPPVGAGAHHIGHIDHDDRAGRVRERVHRHQYPLGIYRNSMVTGAA